MRFVIPEKQFNSMLKQFQESPRGYQFLVNDMLDASILLGAGKLGKVALSSSNALSSRVSPLATIASPSIEKPLVGTTSKQWRALITLGKDGKIKSIRGTQVHHIVHQALADHRLFKAAGIDVEIRPNKIRLPDKKGVELWDTKRSIHDGPHYKDIRDKLETKMTEILREGEVKGYDMMKYREKLDDLMRKEYIELHQGRVGLNKHKREWAIEPAKKK
jgi:hypothetical protein